MRIRTIKPEFWKSESNGRLSRDARLLFIGLFNHADDEGRFRANPALLKAELFPYDADIDIPTFRRWLDELSTKARKVVFYTGTDGDLYGYIPSFALHQKIDRPTPSKLPIPTETSTIRRVIDEGSRGLDVGSGIRDQGMDQGSGNGVIGASGENPPATPPPPQIPPAKVRKPRIQKLVTDDAEWFSQVKSTYGQMGIDVERELVKAKGWLLKPQAKGRKLTKDFFINWLGNADRVVNVDRALKDGETAVIPISSDRNKWDGM